MIKQDYIDTGKVKFVYRDVSLDFHPDAKGAAIAVNCAGEQNAYWSFQDLLWNKQKELTTATYLQLAQDLKLDQSAFKTCLQDPKQVAEVERDLAYGTAFGVDGTPTFFIGKVVGNDIVDAKMLVGAQAYLVFSKIIDGFMAH